MEGLFVDEKIVVSCQVIEASLVEAGNDRRAKRTSNQMDVNNDKSDNGKIRWLCIVEKKALRGLRHRLCKVKEDKPGVFTISKSWALDEVKTLESRKNNNVVASIGKSYYWSFKTLNEKIEFLYTLVSLQRESNGSLPRLINVDEQLLADQMKLLSQQTSKIETSKKVIPTVLAEEVIHEHEHPNDSFVLENDGFEVDAVTLPQFSINDLLSDFSWKAKGDAADLELRLIAQLQGLEAANVHSIIESEEQAAIVVDGIDESLQNLESINAWLCYYSDLLEKMGQDVHQIEIRNKRMQTSISNERELHSQISKLLGELKVPDSVLELLRTHPFDKSDDLMLVEGALEKLMAVVNRRFDDDLSSICLVTERRALYEGYARQFTTRFSEYFASQVAVQAEQCKSERTRLSKLSTNTGLDRLRQCFIQFRPVLRWLKLIDARKQLELEIIYCTETGKIYRKDIYEFVEDLRQNYVQRKISSDDLDYLFSLPQISVTSAASNAIIGMGKVAGSKLELSRTERKIFKMPSLRRSTSGSDVRESECDEATQRMPKSSRRGDGLNVFGKWKFGEFQPSAEDRMWPNEAITFLYSYLCPVIVKEQNFVMDLFNVKRVETNSSEPGWEICREKMADMKAQNRLQELADSTFGDIRDLVVPLIESSLKYDGTFCVGMMVRVTEFLKQYENTAYSFLLLHLEHILSKLMSLFDKFIDDQIKCIEETKVMLKKRSGILSFVRTFPLFVDRLEMCLEGNEGQTRVAVSKCYSQIVKAIFETLEVVAKDVSTDNNDGKDSRAAVDDKEFLNIHILIVENMHYFHSELRSRKVSGLDQFSKAAKSLYDANLEAYVKIVVRRPLGKLLEFFEGVDDLLRSLSPQEVSFHLQFSKAVLKDILRKFPAKEMRKGLEQLYKRVEKHFASEIGGLLQVVWRGIQAEYTLQVKRYEELMALCYPESGLKLEFTLDELLSFFSEFAKSH